jgi:arabinogalactan endo-1,4-beta-galactosidase
MKKFSRFIPASKTLFFSLCAGAVLLLAPAARAQSFAKGADVGWLPQMEATGYKFYNPSGQEEDCLQILKARGINSVRLRTWVNPSTDPVNGHCSQAETIALAQRCKAAGLRVMIDFHYGDTWNSVGVQNPPAAWASLSYPQMQTALYDYVYNFCTALKAAGVTPEWMQNGNEINSGICRPTGAVSNPAQMTGLLNKGYDAMKAVFPTTKVIIHVAQPQNAAAQTMLDAYQSNGGRWDVTGCSSYAGITNQPAVQTSVDNLRTRYGKEIMMVEVGGRWDRATDTRNTITNWINGMQGMGGTGVFYWEPEGYAPFCTYNMTAWEPNTQRPTLALDAFLAGGTPSLVVNPGFEANAATQAPSSWLSAGTNTSADYTETGAHTGSYRLSHWRSTAFEVTTSQLKTGLANGTYTLRAWVQSGGGQNSCQLFARNFGGTEAVATLPTTSAWTLLTVSNVQVTNGQCEFGLRTNANAGNWCSIDDVEFYLGTGNPAARGTTALSSQAQLGELAGVTLCPNPAAETLTLTLPANSQAAQVRIYSATGQLVRTAALPAGASTLDVSALKMGVYQLQLISDKQIVVKKFIRQ